MYSSVRKCVTRDWDTSCPGTHGQVPTYPIHVVEDTTTEGEKPDVYSASHMSAPTRVMSSIEPGIILRIEIDLSCIFLWLYMGQIIFPMKIIGSRCLKQRPVRTLNL